MTKQLIVTSTTANGQPQQVIIAGTNQQITLNKGMVITQTNPASVPVQQPQQPQTIQLQPPQPQQLLRSQPQTTIQLQPPQQQQPVQPQPQPVQQVIFYRFLIKVIKEKT